MGFIFQSHERSVAKYVSYIIQVALMKYINIPQVIWCIKFKQKSIRAFVSFYGTQCLTTNKNINEEYRQPIDKWLFI